MRRGDTKEGYKLNKNKTKQNKEKQAGKKVIYRTNTQPDGCILRLARIGFSVYFALLFFKAGRACSAVSLLKTLKDSEPVAHIITAWVK